MSTTKVSKKEYSKKEHKRILKVNEYVFEMCGNDISGLEVMYCFNYIHSTVYKDGKKMEDIDKSVITIELCGEDRDGKKAWLCFDLKTDVKYLNTLSKIPSDISHLLSCSEAFIKYPSEELSTFLDFELPKNIEEDIYKNFSSLWISKIRENEFIMKLCVPNQVFTYFRIVFENN